MSEIITELYETIRDRKDNPIEESYTNYLFQKGIDKILKKVGEEASEVIIASKNDSKEDLVGEISDLVYHLTVLMVEKNIEIKDLTEELERRHQKIRNKKQEKNYQGID